MGFFDSMVAATACFEDAVKGGEYDHVIVFTTGAGYDNDGSDYPIIREFNKEGGDPPGGHEPSVEHPEYSPRQYGDDNDVFLIEITLTSTKDEVLGLGPRELLWEEQYITEALARVMWDGGIMDGSIERVSTRVRSRMDLHIRSPSWDHLAPADLFVEFVLRKISYECITGDRTLELITMPVAEFWVLYPPPETGAF